jgi:hypothetical protein
LDFPTNGERSDERRLDARRSPISKHRRSVTPQFKAQAVQLVTEPGRSIAEVARDLAAGIRARGAGGPRAFPGRA